VAKAAKKPAQALASNKKALHDYEVLETLEAGLVLSGTEVKSVREGKVQLKDSYVGFQEGQAHLIGVHISPYSHGNRENHEAERPRRLLLHRGEIDRLYGQVQQKGLSVVPLDFHLEGPWVKVQLALVRGKKLYEKRQAEKEKTLDREMRQAVAERNDR
jgi:SsrA-binding protein